jgi:hypothetical protein
MPDDITPDDYIWILTDAPPLENLLEQPSETPDSSRGDGNSRNPYAPESPKMPPPPPPSPHLVRVPVRVEKMQQGMAEFLQIVGKVVGQAQASARKMGGMELEEMGVPRRSLRNENSPISC